MTAPVTAGPGAPEGAGPRFQEARCYIGVSLSEAAKALGLHDSTLDWIETGQHSPSESLLRRMSRLYRRPPEWLLGHPAPPVEISPELDRIMEGLSDHDRGELVRFAEFLQHDRATLPTPAAARPGAST